MDELKRLADIRTLNVDLDLPKIRRLVAMVRHFDGNPYRFMYKDIKITTRFNPDGPPIEDCVRGIVAHGGSLN